LLMWVKQIENPTVHEILTLRFNRGNGKTF
jgi:hypothetical protein